MRKNGRYSKEVFQFNDLWRKEMKEAKQLLENRGCHPLHTEQDECTLDFMCCLDTITDPYMLGLLVGISEAAEQGSEIITIEGERKVTK